MMRLGRALPLDLSEVRLNVYVHGLEDLPEELLYTGQGKRRSKKASALHESPM
jgi:hypothetical protein